jgi:hypothetical protein
LRTVRERAKRFAERAGTHPGGPNVAPLVRALDVLFTERGTTLGQPAKQLPDAVVGQVTIDRVGDQVVSTIPFRIEHAPGTAGSTVEAHAHVATHDGWTAERERSGPAEELLVAVLGFRSGARQLHTAQLVVGRDDESDAWSVQVRSDARVAITVDLVTQSIGIAE